MSNPLNDFGLKIFLDRYAQKDTTKATLAPEDTVVVCVDQKTRQREVGKVMELIDNPGNKPRVKIQLLDGTETVQDWDDVDKPLEVTAEQTMARTARGIASIENEAKRGEWEEKFKWLLDEWRFVPGGRILAGAGTDQSLTYFNCYVIPSPKDSRGGIVKTLEHMMEIMSRGGGVGINLSSLRPRHGYVKGVNGRSSGSVSWGGLYSFVTGLIEQGGSRRGALMLILNADHPDVIDFIDAKREAGKITNANISVAIPDAFMTAVEEDGNWELVFPDTAHPSYDAEWDGDLNAWRAKGYPVVVHRTVKARELWHKISASAHASAEPGILFIDRVNAMSNSHYYSRLICTNPCGEQPLPEWGICNLGAVNLGAHVRGGKVQWQELEKTVRYAVRFLDNVIDATPYFIEENRKQQQRERRVGLGIMGLAEMLVRCGIRYGSDECTKFVDKLGKHIAVAAYTASAEYAAEKGSFPEFNADELLKSGYMQGMPESVRELVRENGLRNVTLLTVAPTGTTGTMVDTSTGVEPYFSWTYWRKSRLGMNEIEVDIAREWREANPGAKDLPEHFVTAMELTPEEHVRTQAALQRWIDSALSKTCNAPNNYTVEQVQELYELMYKLGCKGGTIYRDGSRDEQVLMLKKDSDEKKEEKKPTKAVKEVKLRERPRMARGLTIEKDSPVGRVFVTVNVDTNGNPIEIFVTAGKAGSDVTSMAEGIGRACSFALQLAGPMTSMERLSEIAEQFTGIGGTNVVGIGKNQIRSLPEAIAKAIEEIAEEIVKMQTTGEIAPRVEPEHATPRKRSAKRAPAADICPNCGAAAFIREEGCQHCTSCGHSRC